MEINSSKKPGKVSLNCKLCEKVFSNFYNLKRHVKNVHPLELETEDNFSREPKVGLSCKSCNKTFSKSYNLKRHLKNHFPLASETNECTAVNKIFECPCCNACVSKNNLSVHFQEEHEIRIETENVEVATFEDFKSWKETIERETKFKYMKARGAKISSTGKIHYFKCHRSGNFKPTGNELRNAKIQGSNKIGKFCPAYMRVFEESSGKCSIIFTKTHVGHPLESESPECIASNKIFECPCCSAYVSKDNLSFHFQEEHEIRIETENIEFATFEDFKLWKETVEKETKFKYVKASGISTSSTGKTHYFRCHRSGNFKPTGNGLRNIKMQGTNKIGKFCPAYMRVFEEENGKCSITFTKTHIGHQNDLGRLCLSESERELLASKIAAKVPFDVILDDVRGSVSETSGLERLHLVTKKDLYNIGKYYNLNSSAMQHKNNGTSIDAWVNETRTNENDCVLFYKPQDITLEDYPNLKHDDFLLIIMNDAQKEVLTKFDHDCICMDETHLVSNHNVGLISLIVLNDVRQGFPCVFMLSNRCDQTVLALLLSEIKKSIGNLTTSIFMSNMPEAFYNAWKEEMGAPTTHLYCSWHVDDAWRKNLKKIKDHQKQCEIYKMLRRLLEERDRKTFQVMLEICQNHLLQDEETAEFGKYFLDTFAKCTTLWAFCYRLHCSLDANVNLECVHRTLRYEYLKGQNAKRLDKGISAIMQLIKDDIFDGLLILKKGNVASKARQLKRQHKASLLCDTTVVQETNRSWIVTSKYEELYVVRKIIDSCSCNLKCRECNNNPCLHMYTCSCVDSAIRNNMCRHIHKVCMEFKFTEEFSSSADGVSICMEDGENATLVEYLQETSELVSSSSVDVNMERERIIEKALNVAHSLNAIDELAVFDRQVESVNTIVAAMRSGVGEKKSS